MRIRYNVLFIKSKIQFFESKSQLFFCKPGHDLCCLSSQRYNFLKANHNGKVFFNFAFGLFIKSKIQFFESKSQPWSSLKSGSVCCLSSQRYNFLKANHNANGVSERTDFVVYQVKDTIFWKQITTIHKSFPSQILLFIKSKIQFFESKSQLKSRRGLLISSCLSSQRYNFLKANHNEIPLDVLA